MADGKIQVGKVEHYATYLALVISMITTLLLGMLLTETLFGTGLNYFGRLSEEAKIQKSQARSICYRTADGSGSCDTNGKPRGGVGPSASSMVYNGHVEWIDNNDGAPLDPAIVVGTPFTVTIPLPSTFTDIDPSSEWAYIQVPGPARYTVGSMVLDYPDPMLVVHDAGAGIDYIAVDGRTFSGVNGIVQAGWTDTSILSSDRIPNPFSRSAEAGDPSLVELRADFMNTSTPWTISGEVDSISIR